MKVVIPSTPYDAKGLLIQAIRDDDPVIFLENKLMYDDMGEVPDGSYTVPFGEAAVPLEGKDVTIIAFGRMVRIAKRAAERLRLLHQIEATVIDPRTTSPLDEETILESVRRTGRVVIADESYPRCGMAADISSMIAEKAFYSLKAPILKVTPPHAPVPYAPSLERAFVPMPSKIEAAAVSLFKRD